MPQLSFRKRKMGTLPLYGANEKSPNNVEFCQTSCNYNWNVCFLFGPVCHISTLATWLSIGLQLATFAPGFWKNTSNCFKTSSFMYFSYAFYILFLRRKWNVETSFSYQSSWRLIFNTIPRENEFAGKKFLLQIA